MARLTKRETAVLRREMSQIATGIVGRHVYVFDTPKYGEYADALAFTDGYNKIAINFDNKRFFDELSKDQIKVFGHGALTHEIMHILMSDNELLEHALKRLSKGEQSILATLDNILEDSSIEYYAPQFIGGHLLGDLNFTRAYVYKKNPRIDEGTNIKHPYYQYVAAAIQFGDAGLIKGEFTFPEAKAAFQDTISIWNQGVLERQAFRRILLSQEIFEKTRHLWQDLADLENLADLLEVMRSHGKGGENSFEAAVKRSKPLTPEEMEMGETARDKRRRVTINRITKEEAEELMEEGTVTDELPPEGDVTVYLVEGEEEGSPVDVGDKPGEESPDSGGSDSGSEAERGKKSCGTGEPDSHSVTEEDGGKKDDDAVGAGRGSGEADEASGGSDSSGGTDAREENTGAADAGSKTGKAADGLSKDASHAIKPKETGGTRPDGKPQEAAGGGVSAAENSYGELEPDGSDVKSPFPGRPETYGAEEDEDRIAESIEEEYTIPLSRLEELHKSLDAVDAEMKTEEAAEGKVDSLPLDLPLSNGGYKGVCKGRKCLNISVKLPSPIEPFQEQYDSLLQSLQPEVSLFSRQFHRIMRDVFEEKVRRTSGRVNIPRLSSGRNSSRVFDRRLAPSDRNDVEIIIAIDESGSMSGEEIRQAMLAVIGLTEAFGPKVRVYVMGFTADDNVHHADAVHYHYMRWRNTKEHRLRLLNIAARSNNFDGYSIRHAHEILKRGNAAHKLMIIISDGAPACNAYNSHDGNEDTRQAIKEASQTATVIGVLVGHADPDLHRMFYGQNFLHVTDAKDLFRRIGGFLANLIKGW